MENHELTLQRGRVLAYPKVAKPFLKLFRGSLAIIIGMQHTDEDALAEATRSNEEEVAPFLLQLGYVHALIYEV